MAFTFTFTKLVFHHGNADTAGVWLIIGSCRSKNLVGSRDGLLSQKQCSSAALFGFIIYIL